MSDTVQYYFDGFALSVHHPSYLVEVRSFHWAPPYLSKVSDLPDWVFNSRLAIWIMDESGSIYERSLAGERIRKSLMEQRAGRVNR